MDNDILVLTSSALISFLAQIEELEDLELELNERNDSIEVKIGQNTYTLQSSLDSVVEVDEEVVDDIADINDDGYVKFEDSLNNDLTEIEGDLVQGGIIKELVKTLAIGGLVRLTKDALS